MTTVLLVFAKAPLAGLAKTRLIPALGADGAAAAHARSTVGRVRSAPDTVNAIDRALAHGARWLAPDPLARFGALLWRIAPGWYLASVRRRFAGELR